MNQKIIFIVLVIILVSASTTAQEISRWVIGSGGNTLFGQESTLSLTIGQSGLVGKLDNESFHIIAGFQQMQDNTYTYIQDQIMDFAMKLYPNPFRDHIMLTVDSEITGNLEYRIYDLSGKLILIGDQIGIHAHRLTATINLPNLNSGVYSFSVSILSSGQIHTFSIPLIKTY